MIQQSEQRETARVFANLCIANCDSTCSHCATLYRVLVSRAFQGLRSPWDKVSSQLREPHDKAVMGLPKAGMVQYSLAGPCHPRVGARPLELTGPVGPAPKQVLEVDSSRRVALL
jgi:hypothetical protein